MTYHIEVCIDNLESLHYAIEGGATRIELCTSLALGGLTPSFGFMKVAAETSTIPVYAMIRPRQGDFLYHQEDIDAMLLDIEAAAEAGLQGVVLGALNSKAQVDMHFTQQLVERAKLYGLGVTFHRAFDQCVDYQQALEDIITLGCERVLTSGLAANVEQGVEILTDLVKLSDGRISVMAGAGLNAENALPIVNQTGVREVHLSGKSVRNSKMAHISADAKMGSSSIDDFTIPVTDPEAIRKVVKVLSS